MTHSRRAKNSTDSETTAKYYLTNARLLPEVIRAKSLGRVTDELAMMLMMLAKKYSMKPCFSGYTYRDDMVAEALAGLCQNALKFDPERSDNPFAFYTACITHSFLHILKSEKKHRRIRDQLLIDIGENPSYNFVADSKSHGAEYQSDLADLTSQIAEAKERVKKEDEIELAKIESMKAAAALAAEIVVSEIVDDPETETAAESAEDETSKKPLLEFD